MRTLILTSSLFLLAGVAHAENLIDKTARGIGDGAKVTAKTTKTVVRKTGNGAEKGFNGTVEAGRMTADGADKTLDAGVSGTKKTARFFGKVGRVVSKSFRAAF